MKTRVHTAVFAAILLYLCSYFLQLFKFPNALMLLIGACFCFLLLGKQKRIRVNIGLCLIAITMFSFCIIQFGLRAILAMMPYVVLLIWVLADYLGAECENEEKIIYVVYSMVLGHLIYGVLNAYMYFSGTGVPGTRYWFDIWTQQLTPGTQLTMYFISVFAVFFPSLVFWKRRKIINSILIAGVLFFVFTSLATKTRTTLLVLVIVFLTQSILFVLLNKEKVKKIFSNKKIWLILLLSIAIVGVFLFAIKDTLIIREFVENFDKGGGILNNSRFTSQRKAIKQLFDYPMGGRQMDLGFLYCHNVWLDMANAAGLIPFFAFSAFTLYSVCNLIYFNVQKKIHTETKLVMTGMYVAFFLYYTVEPALDASVHFITPWILTNGLIHGYMMKEGQKNGIKKIW